MKLNQSSSASQRPVLRCHGLSKSYGKGKLNVEVLRELNFEVNAGERVAIVGRSGAGKTTLLTLLGGLDTPDSGEISLMGAQLQRLKDKELTRMRNQYLGFVYQFHHLLAEFSALENVALPLLVGGKSSSEAYSRADAVLGQVGLAERTEHKPAELSGGERQRVAIARALVGEPACVLLDEPTGNLDRRTAEQIQRLMLELSRRRTTAFVTVTHDSELAAGMDKVYALDHQRLRLVDKEQGLA